MKESKKGFTLIELMVVIAILGLLLSLAVPSYLNTVVKARVAEGLQLAEGAKLAVSEYVMLHQRLPISQEETGYQSPQATSNIKSLHITEQGQISIDYTKVAGNGNLLLQPLLDDNGELRWVCKLGSLPAKYAPASCQNKGN